MRGIIPHLDVDNRSAQPNTDASQPPRRICRTDLQQGKANTPGMTGHSSPKGSGNSSLEPGASGGVRQIDLENDEASQTRVQTLERFGIDLSCIGVLTTERTASRLLRVTTGDSDAIEARSENEHGNSTSIAKISELSSSSSSTRSRKRDTGGTVDAAMSAGLLKPASETHQGEVAAKLKALDMLLEDDPVSNIPSVEVGKSRDACVNNQGDIVGEEESVAGVACAGVIGDEAVPRNRVDVSSLNASYTGVAEDCPSGNIPDRGSTMVDAEDTVSPAKRQQALCSGGSSIGVDDALDTGKGQAVASGHDDNAEDDDVAAKKLPEDEERKRDLSDKALPSHRQVPW